MTLNLGTTALQFTPREVYDTLVILAAFLGPPLGRLVARWRRVRRRHVRRRQEE